MTNLYALRCFLHVRSVTKKCLKKFKKICAYQKKRYLCNAFEKKRTYDGAIAQLVEQRTENPCVPGSIPGGTTKMEMR